jgi:hypothetical protein
LLQVKKVQPSQWSRQQADEHLRHTKSQHHQVAQNAQSTALQDHAPSLASPQALRTHSRLSPSDPHTVPQQVLRQRQRLFLQEQNQILREFQQLSLVKKAQQSL